MKLIQQAFKILSKYRLFYFINLIGLVLCLSSGITITRYLYQELTVDHYVPDLGRTYLFVREFTNSSPRLSSNIDRNNDPNHINILADPAIETFTTYMPVEESEVVVDNQRHKVNTIVTDTAFLKILPHPLKAGYATFQSPYDAVITEKLARRIFGKTDPLGKTLTIHTGDILTITGIIEEPVTKSSIQFDILASMELKKHWGMVEINIIKLFPGADVKVLNEKYKDFRPLRSYWNKPSRLQFFPLKSFYLDKTVETYGKLNSIYIHGSSMNIVILTIVVILLIVVGFFNYINIYTVLMLNRAREFGVKKVYGAGSWAVLRQIWLENLLVISVALLLVWAVIEVSSGWMETILSFSIKGNILFDIRLSLAVLIVFSLLVSIPPTIKYSSAPPVISLQSVNMGGKSVVSRGAFLILQYVVTFVILVVSLFFMKQLHYMLHMDLGYRTENVLKFSFFSQWDTMDVKSEEEYEKRRERIEYVEEVVKQKLMESPLFEKWSKGTFLHTINPDMPFRKNDGEYNKLALKYVSPGYMDIFNFQLLEGRLWDSEKDEWAQYKIIINETAKKLFDINDISTEFLQPENRLWWSYGTEGMDKNPPYEIIGVIKDFKINHLSKATVPLGIVYDGNTDPRDPFIASIVPGKRDEAVKYLRELYSELMGKGDFEVSFLEDEIESLYNDDKNVSRIYSVFAFISVLISCLGLYGLSLFDIRQRYREISLRKVNGATVRDIVLLLGKKYGTILAGSFIMGTVFSYWLIYKYLENFAHKAPVSWWIFAIASIAVVIISYITLAFQISKAVRINPADVLKGE